MAARVRIGPLGTQVAGGSRKNETPRDRVRATGDELATVSDELVHRALLGPGWQTGVQDDQRGPGFDLTGAQVPPTRLVGWP